MNKKNFTIVFFNILLVFLMLVMGLLCCFHILQVNITLVMEVIFILVEVSAIILINKNSKKEHIKEDEERAACQKEQMQSYFELLMRKISSLNDDYSSIKKQCRELYEKIKNLPLSDDVAAIKLEHDIFSKVTAASSACDIVLSGGSKSELEKQINALETVVKQRFSFKK